jgi:hypothetical protein
MHTCNLKNLQHDNVSFMLSIVPIIQNGSTKVPDEYIDALDRILELGHPIDGLDLYKFKTTTSKPSSPNQLFFLFTDSVRFSSQINNTQQKIITINLTVKDNNNHITCTQVIFGQLC